MFCPNCGSKLDDDAKFCANCGIALEESVQSEEAVQPEEAVQQAQPEEAVQQAQPKEAVQQVQPERNEQQAQFAGNVQAAQQMAQTPVKKSVPVKKVVAAVAAIAVVGVAGIAVTSLVGNSSSGSSKAIAYVKNDRLYYKKNMKSSKDAYEVGKLYSDVESVPVEFSEDGKYLYFFSDVEDYSYGTLNRIEVKKIKANSDKNKKNIEEIASDVEMYSCRFIDGKNVIYRDDNKKLIYFDGKDENTIAKKCTDFEYDKDTNILTYYTAGDGYTYSLYSGKLSADMDAEKIDTDISEIISMSNPEFIVYHKYDEEMNQLYVAGIEKEPERISKNYSRIEAMSAADKKLIFVEEKENSQPLYEFVEDDSAKEDQGIQKPDAKEFMSEVNVTEVVGEDTYAYYMKYPEEISYFYEDLWEDDTVGMQCYWNWETDKTYYFDGSKWYALDSTLYQRALDEYDKNADRIELRDTLKEQQYTEYLETAYYYESGKDAEPIIEGVKNIVVSDVDKKLYTYQTSSYSKPKLSSLDSKSDLTNDIEENRTWTTYCSIAGANPIEIGDESVYSLSLSEDHTKCAIKVQKDGEYQILMYSVKGNDIAFEDTLIKDESTASGVWKENAYYYLTDVEDSYGILCCYENGKSEEVLDEVSTDSITLYEDDNCMIGEYDSDGTMEIELYGANYKRIDKFSDVEYMPTYINSKCILMIRRDKLCLYDGSDELKEVDRNVSNYEVMAETAGQTRIY